MEIKTKGLGHQPKDTIRIGCFNTKGVIRNVLYLDSLLETNNMDICAISEHWLFEDNLGFLDSINVKYVSYGVHDSNLNPLDPYRRGKGGVAFLWKKCYTPIIHKLNCGNDRIVGISVELNDKKSLTLLAVYLPDSSQGVVPFLNCLETLHDTYCKYSKISDVIILGDFNVQLPTTMLKQTDQRQLELHSTLMALQLISLSTLDSCQGPGYSFCGYENGPATLIDHICIQETKKDLVINCKIIEEPHNLSDHLPIVVTLDIVPLQAPNKIIQIAKYQWKKLSPMNRYQGYGAEVNQRLINVEKPDIENIEDIEQYYDTIRRTMLQSSDKWVPMCKYKRYLKPYWKSEGGILKTLHSEMRNARIDWIRQGKPRGLQHPTYCEYKKAKKIFRNKMRELKARSENDFYSEIEQAASVNQDQFWKLVNSKRKIKGNCTYEMKIDDKILRNPDDILQCWVEHFSSLYSNGDENDQKFDGDFYREIEKEYNTILMLCDDEPDEIMKEPIGLEELDTLIKKIKIGKAGGPDTVTSEHIKYGGDALKGHLVHLFNGIRTVARIPDILKRGLLITLHKGTHKYSDDRRNHRGITLLNVVYKLFESVSLDRLKQWFSDKGIQFPSKQQGAYQSKMCCLMTSFNLQETVHYYLEREAKVYACLLDTSTAFDTVWHHGLLVKLYKLGIKGKTWKILQQCYTGMETAILYQGMKSDWIPVERSVRQGGVLSPWLYMIYINELPELLEESNEGCHIGGIFTGSPIQADDVCLLSPSVTGLQCMIDTVQQYAYKWRYELNHTKSRVLVFGAGGLKLTDEEWHINDQQITLVTEEKHVGIVLNSKLCSNNRTKEACRKAKNSFFSLLNAGTNPGGLNPVTAMKLIHSITLPSSLFGCELWNYLSEDEVQSIERTLHFCCKTLQGLDFRTRSDIALAMAGVIRMQGIIAIRKLTFLARLIWLAENKLTSEIFKARILQYIVYDSMEVRQSRQLGFVSDVVKLLFKYDLQSYWQKYVGSAFQDFPTQYQWKSVVKKAVLDYEQKEWDQRTSRDPEFSVFRCIHNKINNPWCLWDFSLNNPGLKSKVKKMAKFVARTPKAYVDAQLCIYCGLFYKDIYTHLACECLKCMDERDTYWSKIMDLIHPQISVYVYNVMDVEWYCLMLGAPLRIHVEAGDYEIFLRLSTSYLSSIIKYVY